MFPAKLWTLGFAIVKTSIASVWFQTWFCSVKALQCILDAINELRAANVTYMYNVKKLDFSPVASIPYSMGFLVVINLYIFK